MSAPENGARAAKAAQMTPPGGESNVQITNNGVKLCDLKDVSAIALADSGCSEHP